MERFMVSNELAQWWWTVLQKSGAIHAFLWMDWEVSYRGTARQNHSTAGIWAGSISNTSQHVIAGLIMLSYKLKDISRAGPKHVATSGRVISWLPRKANNLVPLTTSNFFDRQQSWWTFPRVHAQIVDNFEKNYFAYENWRLLPSHLWLIQWHNLILPCLLLFQWCLSTPGSCLACPPLSTALDISTGHWSLSVL